MAKKNDNALPQGSLDLMILKTLSSGKKHGYAVARHIQLLSDEVLTVEEGSLYPALHRMEKRGWIVAEWGLSDANRRAKYYSLTRTGRSQLKLEIASWQKMVEAIGKVIAPYPSKQSYTGMGVASLKKLGG